MIRRNVIPDANQGAILSLLHSLGYFTLDCSAVGQLIPGFGDLLLARRGVLSMAEVKTATGAIRPEQTILHRQLETHGVIVPILRTEDDVLRLAGARRTA